VKNRKPLFKGVFGKKMRKNVHENEKNLFYFLSSVQDWKTPEIELAVTKD